MAQLSMSEIWETQSNASEIGNRELEALSDSAFDQLPEEEKNDHSKPKSKVAKRSIKLADVAGSGNITITENDSALELAIQYCEKNGLDFESQGGPNITQQISAKQLSLLRWKLSQTRKRLKKATSQAVKQKFMHAVNLLQRTQHDKKKLTTKLAATRSNLHEKTEELVETCTALTKATEELNEIKNSFDSYKKEKEQVLKEVEERSIAQMQKVVLEGTSINNKVEERIDGIRVKYETRLSEASKEFETQFDDLEKTKNAIIEKLQLENKMSNNQVLRLTHQLEDFQLSKQIDLDAKLRNNQDLNNKNKKLEATNNTQSEQIEILLKEVKRSKALRDEAVAAATQAASLTIKSSDSKKQKLLEVIKTIAQEGHALTISEAMNANAIKEEKRVNELNLIHENLMAELSKSFTAELEDVQKKCRIRIETEINKATIRIKSAEEEAELKVRDAQASYAKRRSSIVKQKQSIRRNSIQKLSALTQKAQEDIKTLQTSHKEQLQNESTKSESLIAQQIKTIKTHVATIDSLKVKVDQLESLVEEQKESSSKQVDKSHLEEALLSQETLKSQINEMTKRIKTMANEHRLLSLKFKDDAKASELALSGARKQVTELQSNLLTEKSEHKNNVKKLTEEIEALQNTRESKTNELISKLKENLAHKNDELQNKFEESKKLSKKLNVKEIEMKKLETEVIASKKALSSKIEQDKIQYEKKLKS